jgi:hypothetical protein
MSGSITSLGTFNVGRDATAIAIAPNGTRLDLTGITEFSWTPEYKTARSDPLNSPPIERRLPNGHRVSFQIDRHNSNNDALVSQIEAGWWNLGSADPGTAAVGTVFIYITEATGAVTTMQFSGCTLAMTKGGDFRTDSPIKQTIEMYAQRFQKV